MDKEIRNRIQRATQDARALLEREYARQLEGVFDIRLDGTIAIEPGTYLDAQQCVVRDKLVATVEHRRASGLSKAEAVAEYRCEAAFTMLNRFVALKMLERRGLVQECISRGEQSSGFKEFIGLAPGLVQLSDHGYRLYIESLFDEIGCEVRVLFDRRDPASLLWPRRQALLDLLAVLNAPELSDIWKEDETIGWMYQYFNSDEERRQMRAESQAPRNSRELAVRNQFFTPRYVVKFLTDNTLSRIWYEMRQGKTRLVDECAYLVRRPTEIFLAEGKEAPTHNESEDENLNQEELLKKPAYISFRPKKDPRDLKVLDPACGSGHFLLYAFDLLITLYKEAWEDEVMPESEVTAHTLREDYTSVDALYSALPGLILRYNLHGIDIDPRAAQIAAFALWMRAQRAYDELGIARGERLAITKTNIVVAEPMPGEKKLRQEFIASLDRQLGQLVEQVFEKMELAGEAGALLKIEDEIQAMVRDVYGEHGALFRKTDEERWREAEGWLLNALRNYAEKGQNGWSYRRRLFSEDAARGFAFIDLCQQRYDVLLMNPPFGERPERCDVLLQATYPATAVDLYAMFFERTLCWLGEAGKVGVISNRTWLSLPTFEALRTKVIGKMAVVDVAADLGSFVLEAQVETSAVVFGTGTSKTHRAPWIRLLKTKAKETMLHDSLALLKAGERHRALYLSSQARFAGMPSSVFGYWMSNRLAAIYKPQHSIEARAAIVKQGTATADDFRFLRLAWEVRAQAIGLTKTWARFAKGGEYSPYYDDVHLVIQWLHNGTEIAAFPKAYIRNPVYYGRAGVTWPLRTTSPFGPRAMPSGCAFGHKGPAALPREGISPTLLLGLLASRPARLLLSVRLGAGDDAPGSASKSYEVGLIRDLPFPDFTDAHQSHVEQLAKRAIELALERFHFADETSAVFVAPDVLLAKRQAGFGTFRNCGALGVTVREDRFVELAAISSQLDAVVATALGFSPDDHAVMHEELELVLSELLGEHQVDDALFTRAYLTKEAIPGDRLPGGLDAEEDVRVLTRRRQQFASLRDDESICRLFEIPPAVFVDTRRRLGLLRAEDLEDAARRIISYVVGVAFGHFDVRHILEPPSFSSDAFAELPEAWPGTLAASISLRDYPARIGPGEVLLDDPGHDLDIITLVLEIFDIVWDGKGQHLEEELLEVLQPGRIDLRVWVRSVFFEDHIKRYSKSRRKAPIYWQLATPSASYSVWLYYHRFTKDTFYKVLNDYVTPKFAHEEHKLTRLVQTAGPNPMVNQRKDIAEQEAFVEELRTFREEVARIRLLWNPDLNDGVLINFAPLWRLVPHHRAWQKECKDCWDKLVAGDYNWSHLAMHLWPERVVPKCAEDQSLAIAHGLKEVFWVEGADGKWQARKADKAMIDTLIAERTSPAVKDALHNFLHAPAPTSSRGRGPRQIARRTGVTRANGDSTAGTPGVDPALLDAVKQAIASADDGAGKPEILTVTGLTKSQWHATINALLTQGVVTKTGERRGVRYYAAETGEPS